MALDVKVVEIVVMVGGWWRVDDYREYRGVEGGGEKGCWSLVFGWGKVVGSE